MKPLDSTFTLNKFKEKCQKYRTYPLKTYYKNIDNTFKFIKANTIFSLFIAVRYKKTVQI